MTIPKIYEALAADLASEKILSKTLLGQKESYMMLADKGRLDLATWKQKACEAAEREAALREEASCLKAVLNGMEFKQVDDMVSDGVDACLFLGQESARIIKGIQAERDALREELAAQDRVLRSSCPDHCSASSPVGTVQNYIVELQRSLIASQQRADALESALRSIFELKGIEKYEMHESADDRYSPPLKVMGVTDFLIASIRLIPDGVQLFIQTESSTRSDNRWIESKTYPSLTADQVYADLNFYAKNGRYPDQKDGEACLKLDDSRNIDHRAYSEVDQIPAPLKPAEEGEGS